MKTVCDINMCTSCMACAEICPMDAITMFDELKHVNSVIDENKCIGCGLCQKVCQVINPLSLQEPISWYQGWNKDSNYRAKSSSGAFAYSFARQIIVEGGYVISCRFKKGEFKYFTTNELTELDDIRESKYVKSNPERMYSRAQRLLKEGNTVLFIGLPCHVAGLKLYLGEEYENLITVDLICHGSPSPKLLEMFLNEQGIKLDQIKKIHFRQKSGLELKSIPDQRNDGLTHEVYFTQPSIRDRYSIAFVYGLMFTENCYHCHYAGTNRVSDITLGDSWGSELDKKEKQMGISLAICQTQKGISLLKRCPLSLQPVNVEKAIMANHQLREPFPLVQQRDILFREIGNGKGFKASVQKSIPIACFRLDLKDFLLKSRVLKPPRDEAQEYRISIEI